MTTPTLPRMTAPLVVHPALADACTSNDCDDSPAVLLHWPGRAPAPMCEPCALSAQGLAKFMGWGVTITALVPYTTTAEGG